MRVLHYIHVLSQVSPLEPEINIVSEGYINTPCLLCVFLLLNLFALFWTSATRITRFKNHFCLLRPIKSRDGTLNIYLNNIYIYKAEGSSRTRLQSFRISFMSNLAEISRSRPAVFSLQGRELVFIAKT